MGIRKIPEWQKDKHLFGLWRHSEAEEKKSKLDEVFRNIAGIARSSGPNVEAAKLKKKQEEQREELKRKAEEKKKQEKKERWKEYYSKNRKRISNKGKKKLRDEIAKLPEGEEKERRKRELERVEKARSAEVIACECIGAEHNPTSRPFDGALGSAVIEVKSHKNRPMFKKDIKEFKKKLNKHNIKFGFFFGWAFGEGVKEYAMSENIICINLELAYKKAGVDVGFDENTVYKTYSENWCAWNKKYYHRKKLEPGWREENNARARGYYHEKKDEISARRKELRRLNNLKKEQ